MGLYSVELPGGYSPSIVSQAAEAELAESMDDPAESDELFEEFEEVKRARSLSSIFDKDEQVIEVDASQADESLAVCCETPTTAMVPVCQKSAGIFLCVPLGVALTS